ncbi:MULTISPECIES: hypothetical protein [unclassified Microcoleus]|uniref:hypothetical protein n=1 Tax=unclassified Microcoleus TaxID=2642155 RepID=UPI001D9A320A|nr:MULTISPECIES: hypothetical protein [unclassified Microcoleus]MCC3503412.1 hypothetical protein [Microcoleus sp. PH2017_19_SFW_U_A]
MGVQLRQESCRTIDRPTHSHPVQFRQESSIGKTLPTKDTAIGSFLPMTTDRNRV